jgi:hypothetical protein
VPYIYILLRSWRIYSIVIYRRVTSCAAAGAMDTGSTLAALAKQMRLTQGHGISSAPPDARVEESASLEQRAAGAKELLAKAKAERLVRA